jgi:TonB family protein
MQPAADLPLLFETVRSREGARPGRIILFAAAALSIMVLLAVGLQRSGRTDSTNQEAETRGNPGAPGEGEEQQNSGEQRKTASRRTNAAQGETETRHKADAPRKGEEQQSAREQRKTESRRNAAAQSQAEQQPDTGPYHVVTSDDGLSCAFSQDISASVGYGLRGTMSASANHFKCKNGEGSQVDIELVSADPNVNARLENGKVAIRTKKFGTVYRGNEAGQLDRYEMTDSQIKRLKSFLATGVVSKGPPQSNKEEAVPEPQRIRVGGNVQQTKLIIQPHPVYPPLAKQARISGTVTFNAIIGTDGHIVSLTVVKGHPLLIQAAMDAVKNWVYSPTLLNGEPVEVATTIDVVFTFAAE